jgi:hypothetical protein
MTRGERAALARWAHDLLIDLEDLSGRVMAVAESLAPVPASAPDCPD